MSRDVSVLLATYNSAPYVQELVDSILASNYRDFELIARDDASTDGTPALLQGLTDDRVRVLLSDVQSGSAQNNFYQLLLSCENDYIMFADADDFWLPDKIGKTRDKSASSGASDASSESKKVAKSG